MGCGSSLSLSFLFLRFLFFVLTTLVLVRGKRTCEKFYAGLKSITGHTTNHDVMFTSLVHAHDREEEGTNRNEKVKPENRQVKVRVGPEEEHLIANCHKHVLHLARQGHQQEQQ